jgi:glycerol uptake facilitator-like aquaporin
MSAMREDYNSDDEDLSLMDSADGLGGSPRSGPGGSRREGGELSSLGGGAAGSIGVRGGPGPVRASSSSFTAAVPAVQPAASASAAAAARISPGSFRAFLTSAALSEFVGTFFLVYLGLSGIYASNMVNDDALKTGSLFTVAIGYGFAYGCIIYSMSLNGGGYLPSIRQMNPALTVALYFMNKLDGFKSLVLMVAQILGAALGTGLVFLCFNRHSIRTFELYDSTNVWQQVFTSIFISFLFIFVLLITNFAVNQPVLQQAVSTDTSEQAPQTTHELNSIIAALVCTVCTAAGTPISGCFMNPLFALTLLSLTAFRNNVAVVILGPLFGAALAALVARLFSYRTRAPFLATLRWGAGGMGGLGLGNLPPPGSHNQMSSLGPGGPSGPPTHRANPFNPNTNAEEKVQGSRF